jgi:5-methylcytosine-specific restriction protein A
MALKPCISCGTPSRGSRCPTHEIRNGSTRQWRSTRAAILARDHWQCQICGHRAEHVDHILPLAHGGTDAPSNLRATCTGCNLSRST